MPRTNNLFVLLDRDGVINQESHDFIKSPEEWQPLDGSLEAIALLNQYGYQVAIITNQSGLARGMFDEADLAQIHAKMQRLAVEHGGKISAIYYCPHGPDSTCYCRKPKPGLLLQCAADHQIDLPETIMIGDSYRDLQAGFSAGAQPVLVKTGNGKTTLSEHPDLNIPVFENLYDAAKYIISRQ